MFPEVVRPDPVPPLAASNALAGRAPALRASSRAITGRWHEAARPRRDSPSAAEAPRTLATALVATGALTGSDLRRLRLSDPSDERRLCAELMARGVVAPGQLADLRAMAHGMARLPDRMPPPDARLIVRFGLPEAVAAQVFPGWRTPQGTLVAIADPRPDPRLRLRLEQLYGEVRLALATPSEIERLILATAGQSLCHLAETRAPERESCRPLGRGGLRRALPAVAAAAVLCAVAAPGGVVLGLMLLAALSLLATTALRAGALLVGSAPPRAPDPALGDADLPVISVIVPMFGERDIAPRLVQRLGRIDYPRDRLDVILAVEQCDPETRAALDDAGLPRWMRVLTVPDGTVRTKPRALNFALPFARGRIIGIYDAEDAPARDQLRKVAARFAAAPPDVACLQGILDYYNPATNWIARCFALEYAAWFRILMPGLERLGVPLPLGGTTLFVRTAVLEAVGAWDAHNVTEDADLGIRLAVHGYRTEMLTSVTEEEANCRLRPWIRQRSRWIKGHILTWLVHMRDPARLWRRLGARGFIGYQIVFLGAQAQFLLAPVLWSFWLVAVGGAHPAVALLPGPLVAALIALVVLAEALSLAIMLRAARLTRHPHLWAFIPALHAYFPLATIAAWRAAFEAVTRPFYWAKTSHGHFDSDPAATLATPAGFEPATIRLEGECSIRLSYGADGHAFGPAPRPSQAPSAGRRLRVM